MALAQKASVRRLAALWAVAALLCGAVLGAPAASDDDYTDENRPYEFGFVIEGQQHRHEKKDERGIIMGEFGFITADGVYHVTVYATDENGDFKIISMKNIRLGPPLDQMRTAPRTSTTARPVTSPPVSARTSAAPAPASSTRAAIKLNGANGCGGCLIPTTTAATPPAIGSELQPPFPAGPASAGTPGLPGASSGGITAGSFGGGAGAGGGGRDRTGGGVADRIGGSFGGGAPGSAGSPLGGGSFVGGAPGVTAGPQGGGSAGSVGGGTPGNGGGSIGGGAAGFGNRVGGGGSLFGSQEAGQPRQPPVGSQPVGQRPAFGSTPGKVPALTPTGGQPGTAPSPPTGSAPASPFGGAVSPPGTRQQGGERPASFGQRPTPGAGGSGEGVQTPAGGVRPPPGEAAREGLPPGVTMSDVMDALLYRFNYTLPYHGHHEEGYRSGNKLGGYFADDRDGSGRSVKYLANEFGYQPNITLVDLRPQQAHTEEDERNAPLLGYKFEWLY